MQMQPLAGVQVGSDVRLTLDMGIGVPVEVEASCYAARGSDLYLHLDDPIMAYGLPSKSLVLLDGAAGEEADRHPLPRCRGLLERVDEPGPGPPVDDPCGQGAPIWRVRLAEPVQPHH